MEDSFREFHDVFVGNVLNFLLEQAVAVSSGFVLSMLHPWGVICLVSSVDYL